MSFCYPTSLHNVSPDLYYYIVKQSKNVHFLELLEMQQCYRKWLANALYMHCRSLATALPLQALNKLLIGKCFQPGLNEPPVVLS